MSEWTCPDCRDGGHEWCSGGCACPDQWHTDDEREPDDDDTQWVQPGEVE